MDTSYFVLLFLPQRSALRTRLILIFIARMCSKEISKEQIYRDARSTG